MLPLWIAALLLFGTSTGKTPHLLVLENGDIITSQMWLTWALKYWLSLYFDLLVIREMPQLSNTKSDEYVSIYFQ